MIRPIVPLMRRWLWLAAPCVIASALAAPPPPTITLSTPYVQLSPNQPWQFQASVSDGSPVIWQAGNIIGGSSASGTIDSHGVYTQPATLPDAVTVTAVLVSDPMVTRTATITFAATVGSGRTMFVSPSGNDAAPGTMAAPFRTLTHAAALSQPGDTIYARQGIYHELLAPKQSGTAAGYITFSAYPNETATIDGTGLPIPNGQAGLVTLANLSYVVVQGFEVRNYHTASINAVPVGIFVSGAGRNIQLVNNHIHAIITTAPTTPAQCQSNALGMAVYGTNATMPLAGVVITGNELDHLKTGCSESMSLDGNVDGFLVASNLVHDNDNIGIDAIGFERVSPDPATDQARNGTIRGNTVRNITSYNNPDYGKQYASDGIYVDGATQIVIEQNLVHNTDYGIELASEHQGRTTSNIIARNNVIYANNAAAITIGGYGARRGGTDHCTIVNNTLFADETKKAGAGEFQIQFNATNNVFENNIVYAGPPALLVNGYAKATSAPTLLDYNLYFAPGPAASAAWIVAGHPYKGLAAYRAATGLDSHSIYADPLFSSIAPPPVLTLQANSLAIGAGVDLGPATLGPADFAGRPRSPNGSITLGAFAE